jgi:extracellular factor (EF) 3-hydroxypalmitic acid methyl ester biosynthesis protein
MGLFDYLTKPVATAVLQKLYHLLLPGGEMIIGNFAPENPTMVYMAYWMDWTIIYRSENEMLELASELEGAVASTQRDETGVQILLHIKKQAEDG